MWKKFDNAKRGYVYVLESFEAVEQPTRYKLVGGYQAAFHYHSYVDKKTAILSPESAKAKALCDLSEILKALEDRIIETQDAIEQVKSL